MTARSARRASARTVLYLVFANPASYPPLQHSAELLAAGGWRVIVLGVPVPGTERLRFSCDSRIDLRLLPPARAGWRQKVRYLQFCAQACWLAIRQRPAWVYASDPLSCPAALALSVLPGVRVLYHEHDLPPADEGPESWFMRLVVWSRRQLFGRAKLIVAPNAERARLMSGARAEPVSVVPVWNCPPARDVVPQRQRAPGERPFYVVYHGTLVPARVPAALIQAFAMLPPCIRLRLAVVETAGHVGYAAALRALAAALGLADRLEIHVAVPTRSALLALVDASDVGLALLPKEPVDPNERTMTGASNKAFDYLARGIPFIVSDLPDWRRVFVEPGYARACDPADPASIAAAIRWFYEHPDEGRAMGEEGRRQIIRAWNYDRQFEPVRAIMTAAAA